MSKSRARATALAFVVPQNCMLLHDLTIHVCLYCMIPEGHNDFFLVRPRPNNSAEGLHFSTFLFENSACLVQHTM